MRLATEHRHVLAQVQARPQLVDGGLPLAHLRDRRRGQQTGRERVLPGARARRAQPLEQRGASEQIEVTGVRVQRIEVAGAVLPASRPLVVHAIDGGLVVGDAPGHARPAPGGERVHDDERHEDGRRHADPQRCDHLRHGGQEPRERHERSHRTARDGEVAVLLRQAAERGAARGETIAILLDHTIARSATRRCAARMALAAASPVSHPPSMKPCASTEQCSPAKWRAPAGRPMVSRRTVCPGR